MDYTNYFKDMFESIQDYKKDYNTIFYYQTR